jgi:DNA-binding CsgD family transcriptional regulator
VVTKPRSHAARSAESITVRQREVLGLIARGLTNKEMGHSLGITERGAAAHVSRLLARFRVPNRAGLIARTLSDAIDGRARSTVVDLGKTVPLPGVIERELEAYRKSPFMIGLTVGPDNLLVYVNEAGKRMYDIAPESAASAGFAARRASTGTDAFREASTRAFRSGNPTTIDNQRARWLRDDGTWSTGSFSCVVQPVREATGSFFGLLWICMPT